MDAQPSPLFLPVSRAEDAASATDGLPCPPGEILDELPGCAPGPRSSRRRPFESFGSNLIRLSAEAQMRHVAEHHVEVLILAAAMKPEPEAEPV
jgi:hypothetical protein